MRDFLKSSLGSFLVLVIVSQGFSLTGQEILKKVNDNLNFKSAIMTVKMEIYLPNQKPRVKVFKSWVLGEEKAYVEFLNAEDKNIRYLKIGKKLWIYDRNENNTFLISGHLLKQGMMGSDISYEDILESEDIYNKYSVSLEGEEKLDGKDCYVLLLKARVENVSYPTRKLWVQKSNFVPIKEELFALSGRLLKVIEVGDVKSYGNRYYPSRSVFYDKLKENTKTVITVEDVVFDVSIPESIFTRRYLER